MGPSTESLQKCPWVWRDAGRRLLLTPVANLFLDREWNFLGPGQKRPALTPGSGPFSS